MNTHIIVVAYGLAEDLTRLYASANSPDVTWHIFLHSKFPDVVEACETLVRNGNVNYYDYGHNRGLARSWNEGLYNAYFGGADVMMIANDDAVAGEGDVARLAEAAITNPDYYFIDGIGFDQSTNQHKSMKLSLAVINPIGIETIGYFDETFTPIYFEDIDYYRRASLAGLKSATIGGTHIVHAGSKSRTLTDESVFWKDFNRNRDYYVAKWGGDQGCEGYQTPFNQDYGMYIGYEDRQDPYPNEMAARI